LGGNGNVEVILTEIEERDEIKRFYRAEIEPARMPEGLLRVVIPT
jgi:hypothetical protein